MTFASSMTNNWFQPEDLPEKTYIDVVNNSGNGVVEEDEVSETLWSVTVGNIDVSNVMLRTTERIDQYNTRLESDSVLALSHFCCELTKGFIFILFYQQPKWSLRQWFFKWSSILLFLGGRLLLT